MRKVGAKEAAPAPTSSSEAVAAALGAGFPEPPTARKRQELAQTLRTLWTTARTAWPEIELEPTPFGRRLARCGCGAGALASIHAADLYLATAVSEGVSGALRAFDRLLERAAADVGRRLRLPAATADEVLQVVRHRLFACGEAACPRIAEYLGRGALEIWLRAVLTRTALNLRRTETRARDNGMRFEQQRTQESRDPEVEFLRRRYQREINAAFKAALATLTDEECALLRLHVAQGVSLDDLATMWQLGRTTVARRLAAARRKLRHETQRWLMSHLRVTESDASSLTRLMHTEIDASVCRLLARA